MNFQDLERVTSFRTIGLGSTESSLGRSLRITADLLATSEGGVVIREVREFNPETLSFEGRTVKLGWNAVWAEATEDMNTHPRV
jgi:hypothetical protein